ncbi:Uu.00g118790.m01.CDS01 [Anthostomella pinea]|uniref:Uu.00g118790.m01.CDS01 n=1 Tax=Anthostomella pinea TaxID=933095 RepID=A0AAI8YGZ1_9PEZI|nr:Uu.00g118790.m01.CDS01 [Anthostomella pinea]
MPDVKALRAATAKLPSGPPLVAAFTGGTTGIGSYIAKALAAVFAADGAKLRGYIVGRNAERAAAVIAECRRISPGSDWRFVQATDLALISEVDKACVEIDRQETADPFHGGPKRLDMLYMTHCYPILKERSTTKEGLDSLISTTYYSRMRFIQQLLLLLTASPVPGHVVSVYAGGMEDGVGSKPGEPLPIGCPPPETYGVTGVRKHSSFMTTFMFEELAQRHAGRISLSYVYPGLVDGPGFLSPEMPLWFRIVWRLLKPLASLMMTKPEDCGLAIVYAGSPQYPARAEVEGDGGLKEGPRSTTWEVGGGSYALQETGDVANKGPSYEKVRKEGVSKQVWDHTMETLERIEKESRVA